MVAHPPTKITKNQTYPLETNRPHAVQGVLRLYVVPDTYAVSVLINYVKSCLDMGPADSVTAFSTEKDMLNSYKIQQKNYNETIMAVVFDNKTTDFSTINFKYKILTSDSLPTSIYNSRIPSTSDVFSGGLTGLQLCLDEAIIRMKTSHLHLNLYMFTQHMPTPAHVKIDIGDELFRQSFILFILVAFLIPFCIETYYASQEKFLGVNVLMAINGVPNFLNLLSWLVTGILLSLFYIIPIVIVVNFTSSHTALPFLYYGNTFILLMILLFNITHLITFGMHISAYFTRPLFLTTALIVIYFGSNLLQKYGVKESGHAVIPFLGIFFPNILLFRACEEINYYETIVKGTHFNNIFKAGHREYGTQGSIGIVLIFSLIGALFHFAMACYIYIINPGKYGARRNPFFFLKFLKSRKSHDYDKVENFEFHDNSDKPFEAVAEGIYTPEIQLRNLKKTYNSNVCTRSEVRALRGVTVDFYQGQISALLGHNGAGKSTILSIISGMTSPTEGLVLVNGKNIRDKMNEIINTMGLCPQENMLFPSLTVQEQLKFFARLKNNKNSEADMKNSVVLLQQELKLFEKRHSLPHELSGGQKRRLCLGMALVGGAEILILDEPTSGLDPESRRDVWDVLLKMRGKKTIILSTHDMEEADILGDRIAIVHGGLLRSYGNPMYLKKLLGQGNIEVTLSTDGTCNPEKIHVVLGSQCEILSSDREKMVVSLPQTADLPDLLDKVEYRKKELGVTGMSVSLLTLEQVFTKVTADEEDTTDETESFMSVGKKLNEQDLCLNIIMALLRKKLTYTYKNVSILLVKLFLILLPLIFITLILVDYNPRHPDPQPIPMRLDRYNDPRVLYKIDNFSKPFGRHYRWTVGDSGGTPVEVRREDHAFEEALLSIGSNDAEHYAYNYIAGATFNRTNNNIVTAAFYNPTRAAYSLPISVNLLTNTILKTLVGNEYNIRFAVQEFPRARDESMIILEANMGVVEAYVIALLLVFFLFPLTALFVVHPLRENINNIKQLQRMAGASCLKYWGTMFAFDYVVFIMLSVLLVVGFIIVDCSLGLRIFGGIEFFVFLGIFVLFGLGFLPLVYCFSFWKSSTTAGVKLLSLLPIGIILLELVMNAVTLILMGHSKTMNIIRPIQKVLFLMAPYTGFFHAQVSFFSTAKTNANCERMSYYFNPEQLCRATPCCDLRCSNGTCITPLKFLDSFKEDISMEASLISLCLTPILYVLILCMLEFKFIPTMIAEIRGGKPDKIDQSFEEQVKKTKHNIAQEISKIRSGQTPKPIETTGAKEKAETNGTTPTNEEAPPNHVFLAYELRKLYGKLVAVQDVSFGVRQCECFGLLGVNGAGKTTTFKLITGEETPSNGIMYLGNKDLKQHRYHYLSQMGYCPQQDAMLGSLNAYDHLRLFARLRGIPDDQVDAEVKKWIDKLGLNLWAHQACDTYSGGNKRRLNVAMALIGIPSLVLMDEPTTGIDPTARRALWNVIKTCQNMGQSVILTSHSMEECEALCNRLAIMAEGKLVCMGPSQELKHRFGAGYNIQIKMNPEKSPDEIENIKKSISDALHCEIIDENKGYIMYHVIPKDTTWRRMFDACTEVKDKYESVEDFAVLSSTLEQLFLMFAKSSNTSVERVE
ncbi:ATP-binding cassette sub-family A member 1-like [Trichogramma pretiosum]|uniref:ATP-binding cassette sub-family A member 1-like n=1 Tax=Trichogramma pretiosum TaxID=7493 RepID=UPI0006C9731C|nr:ATP-binding cassette sub-family A member 1-like [Trichogramma pretiosum]